MQNQKAELGDRDIALSVVTPDEKPIFLHCGSVHVTLRDDKQGRGGGSYGIRPGHVAAVLALAPGPVLAYIRGMQVLHLTCGKGFAMIENTTVTLVTESARRMDDLSGN